MQFIAVLMLGLACLSVAGCTGPSLPVDPPAPVARPSRTLRYFDLINIDVRDVPLLMALDELQAQGITVEKTYLAGGPLIAEALARGDADIGLVNNQSMWTAITKGAQVRTFAHFTASTSVLAATQAIQSCRDLDGRRVGVAGTRGLSPALLDLYFKENCPGVTPQTLLIPESAARRAALLAGETDATILPGEELLKLQREAPGRFHALMSYATEFPNVLIDGLHVRREWAKQNPDIVKGFLRALLKAHRAVAANPQRLIDESVRRLSLDPATAKAVAEAHLRAGIWDANGGLTSEDIQYTIDFLTTLAVLASGLKVQDVADLSYLQAVLNELGRQ